MSASTYFGLLAAFRRQQIVKDRRCQMVESWLDGLSVKAACVGGDPRTGILDGQGLDGLVVDALDSGRRGCNAFLSEALCVDLIGGRAHGSQS